MLVCMIYSAMYHKRCGVEQHLKALGFSERITRLEQRHHLLGHTFHHARYHDRQ
jgi:hypothetical protein